MTETQQAPPAVSPRIYFGWYIVAAGAVVNSVSVTLQGYANGVFFVPMSDELGWSRTEFALAVTAGAFVTAGAGAAFGGVIDRRGGRALTLIGAVLAAGALLAMAELTELWQWYLLRAGRALAGGGVRGHARRPRRALEVVRGAARPRDRDRGARPLGGRRAHAQPADAVRGRRGVARRLAPARGGDAGAAHPGGAAVPAPAGGRGAASRRPPARRAARARPARRAAGGGALADPLRGRAHQLAVALDRRLRARRPQLPRAGHADDPDPHRLRLRPHDGGRDAVAVRAAGAAHARRLGVGCGADPRALPRDAGFRVPRGGGGRDRARDERAEHAHWSPPASSSSARASRG